MSALPLALWLLACSGRGMARPAEDPHLRTRGAWHTVTAVDTRCEPEAGEDCLEGISRVEAEAGWRTRDGGRVALGVEVEVEALGPDPARIRYLAWPGELYRDFRIGGPAGGSWLRVGQQGVRWGRLQAVSLVDVLAPPDLRHGPLPGMATRRVPVPMVEWERSTPAWRAELYGIPFHVPARYHVVGSDWGMFPPGVWEDLVAQAATWEGDAVTTPLFEPVAEALLAELESAGSDTWWVLDRALAESGGAQTPGAGMEAAVRFTWTPPGLATSAMVAWIREDIPTVALHPDLATWIREARWPTYAEWETFIDAEPTPVEVTWPRTLLAGGDLEAAWGPLLIRAEAAYRSARGLVTRELQATTAPELGAGLGVDWSTHPHVQAGVEGSWQQLLAPDPGDLLGREVTEARIAPWMRLSLLRGRLVPGAGLMLDPLRAEAALRARVKWRASDPLTLSTGVVAFFGPEPPPRTLDALLASESGPLGWYGANDAVTVEATWAP